MPVANGGGAGEREQASKRASERASEQRPICLLVLITSARASERDRAWARMRARRARTLDDLELGARVAERAHTLLRVLARLDRHDRVLVAVAEEEGRGERGGAGTGDADTHRL